MEEIITYAGGIVATDKREAAEADPKLAAAGSSLLLVRARSTTAR